MSRVTCAKCGASWPLEKVAGRTSFGCGRCHARVVVPSAQPLDVLQPLEVMAPLETLQPIETVEPLPAVEPAATAHPAPAASHAHPPRHRTHAAHHGHTSHHGHATHHHAPPKRAGTPPLVWVGTGVAVLGCVAAFIALSRDGDTKELSAALPAAKSAASAQPDPMRDAAVWKALPEAERSAMTARVVGETDAMDGEALRRTAEFLTQRGETAAIEALAKRAVEADPGGRWGNETLGHVDVTAEVDACLTQCELAEEHGDESYRALKAERATFAGKRWWAAPADAKRVRDTVALVREADKMLGTPYGAAVTHWARYQRSIEVMKDYPALHATTGPYIIFVALNVAGPEVEKLTPKEKLARKATPEEHERGAKILERNRKLFTEFYEGWMREMGPLLSLTRYGPENCDDRTLLKANVFTTALDFHRYNVAVGAGAGGFVRAYYSPMEPRFITTYDGGSDEPSIETDQIQCHEATHQLVHFYTWDLTRKDLGRDPDVLEVDLQPLWSGEGFAEFFSTHRVVDGKYEWMQPLDERMRQLWIFDEMVKGKGWTPWRLSEFFTLQDGRALERLASARSKAREDEWIATGVMANLFYAKAWSFVYFLWYAEDGGKPKYRDRYVEYLKAEFHVKFRPGRDGKMHPDPVDGRDFMRIMGLGGDGALAAMEREWTAYEAKLVAANRKTAWDEERKKTRANFGFDKPAEKSKDAPPKK